MNYNSSNKRGRLVLTREENESIIIGDHVEVKISKIGPNSVKLIIEAPKEIRVDRKEIYDEIMRNNALAVQSRKLGSESGGLSTAAAHLRSKRQSKEMASTNH